MKLKHFKTLKGTVQGSPNETVLQLFEQAATLAAYDNRMRLDRISELTATRFGAWSKFNFLEKSLVMIVMCLGIFALYTIGNKALLWWQSPRYETLENNLEMTTAPLSLSYIERHLKKDQNAEPVFYVFDIAALTQALSSKQEQFRLPTPKEILNKPSKNLTKFQELAKEEKAYHLCTYNTADSSPSCTPCDKKCQTSFKVQAQTVNQQGFRLVRKRLK